MRWIATLLLIGAIVASCAAPPAVQSSPIASPVPSTASPNASGSSAPTAAAREVLHSDKDRVAADPGAAARGSAALEALSVDLYKELGQKPGDLVFSPYSIVMALAMARAGAVGQTATEMDRVLHAQLAGDLDQGLNALDQALAKRPGTYEIPGNPPAELVLGTANQLWGQRGTKFESPFLDRLAMHYGAGMQVVDYIRATEQARADINKWVAQRTRDRIPELIPNGVLDELTRLVITNAVYLKAQWTLAFSEGATAPAPFHRPDGTTTQVQMMQRSGYAPYGSGSGYQAVRLPYHGGLSMVVVVPDAGTFERFERALAPGSLKSITDSVDQGTYVILGLPKFEFRTEVELSDALKRLGMPTALTPEVADFSGITKTEPIFIANVLHEAFISVDEKGTEAAAATAVAFGATGGPDQIVELTVDRPFLFFIQDDATGAILFLGRVVDPN